MDEQDLALAAGESVEAGRGAGGERWRLRGTASTGVPRALGQLSGLLGPLLAELAAGSLERLDEEGAIFGGEFRRDLEAAVLGVPLPAQKALAPGLVRLGAARTIRSSWAAVAKRASSSRSASLSASATRVSARAFE